MLNEKDLHTGNAAHDSCSACEWFAILTSVISLPPRPQKPLVSKSVKGQGMPSSLTILNML